MFVCGARRLQSEAANKGEKKKFVEAAKLVTEEEEGVKRSCMHCTAAAVMLTPWIEQEETHNVSQVAEQYTYQQPLT